jgi:HlyD family secretion protein
MTRLRTNINYFAIVPLYIVSILFFGCNKKEEVPVAEVTVQAVHPSRGNISEEITADAVLAPLAQAAISPKVTAPIKKFFVQRGSRVKEGQLLAVLENSDLQAVALDNKGSYAAAQASFDTATRATAPEDYTKAQSDLALAKTTFDLNQSIVASRTQLLAQGAIPGRDLDTAKAALVQAQAAYDIAKQHLEAVQQVSRRAALELAQGTLESAKGKYLGAQAQLNYTEIRSPINGIVTDRSLFAGETAAAGTPVLTVMDTSALIAKLHIAQIAAQNLSLGAAATINVPGIADPVPAKVSLISPSLDLGSTTVEVWLRVENPKGIYKAGTPVHATVAGHSVANALVIPSVAVQTANDGRTKSVMLIGADDVAHKRSVTLGLETADLVQVLEGLTNADTVVTTGAYALDDGTKVKVGPPSEDDHAADKSDKDVGKEDKE